MAALIACGTPPSGVPLSGPAGAGAVSGSGAGGAGTAGSSAGGTSAGSGTVLNLGGDLNGGTGGVAGNGMPEVCDGLDNDEDGIIDDVDVGRDGVCDCLNIATLGQVGPWSDGGNIFVTWLNARSPQGAVALDDQVLTPELLAPFHIVVALHLGTTAVQNGATTTAAHHPFVEAESVAFKSWVESGGGAMTTIGYSSDEASEVVNVNLLLAPLGLGYSTTRVDLNGFVQSWQPHPITAGVSNITTQNGVEPEGAGTALATGPNDAIALQVSEVGSGRVVVWGDEWITYDSEWQDIGDQQVELLWLNILKWLSPPDECQVEIPTTVQ